MREIEGIIDKSKIYLLWLNHISEKEAVELFDDDIKDLAKALDKHVQKKLREELELALGKESLNMYHNGGILTKLEWLEHRINELKDTQ